MARKRSLDELHRENIHHFDELAAEVRVHILTDTRRFDTQDTKLAEIQTDLRSLLATRSFTRGIWKAVTIIAIVVSTLASLAVSYLTGRGH